MNEEYAQLRVGLMGIGLEAYWEQFQGLQMRLQGYLSDIYNKIASPTRTIINVGLVDSPEKALAAGHRCRRDDIDILLVYVTTYALSSTVLPAIVRAKVPVLMLNLQPSASLNYTELNSMGNRTAMTGEWLAYCSACPVPEIANVLKRLDIDFYQVTGTLHDDPGCWREIEEWLAAAGVAHALRHCRLGLLGHYYGGMLDLATDLAQVSGRFGIHVEQLEAAELCALRRAVTLEAITLKLVSFREFFEIGSDCSRAALLRAASTSIALDKMVSDKDLDLVAYYYKGTGIAEIEDLMNSIILGASMLTGQGVPIAGEYEVKNAIAMKMMDLLGVGGSFSEYYAIDFALDHVLMGHDGPGHIRIAEDKIKVRPLEVYHGKVGSGLSVEMSVKHGEVTILSVVESRRNGFKLLAAQGESVAGEILEIGNTNSRYKFPLGARGFAEAWNSHGPAHHCAIGVGHIASKLRKLALLLNLDFELVC